jgi:undecaprenyl-phosphate galactose phosphotransferase
VFQHYQLYRINVFLTVPKQIISLTKAFAVGVVGLIVGSFLIKGLDWIDSRAVTAYFAAIGFLSTAIFRTVIFRKTFMAFSRSGIYRRRILIIGNDDDAKLLASELESDELHGFEVVGFADDDLPVGTRVFEELEVVGSLGDLPELVSRLGIQDVVVAQNEISHGRLIELLDMAKESNANVRLTSNVYRIIPQKVALEHYIGRPTILLSRGADNRVFRTYKRAFDLIGAFLVLLVLSLPAALIALLIKLTSKGAVLHRDRRIGKNGKPFVFLKFRTMLVGNDDSIHRDFVSEFIRKKAESPETEPRKIVDDPRVTPIGKILRKFSFDELPQLINVIRGDMSLVGPRPCLPYEWDQYDDWHRRRFDVTPGCTGLWQVSGRSEVSFDDMVILDLFYIENMSPLFDLKIIFKTVPVMLFGKGGY